MESVLTASYFKYWGKAQISQEQQGKSYHLLPYHCLDVAAVGQTLLTQNQPYSTHLAQLTGLDIRHFIPWYTYLLALHDIGKFADSFQNLKSDVLWVLQKRDSHRQYGSLRHDSLGWILWKKHLREQFRKQGIIPEIQGSKRRRGVEQPIDIWMSAMVGHHGRPPKTFSSRTLQDDFDSNDFESATSFAIELMTILQFDKVAFPQCDMERIKLASWWLAGLAVLCDWLGSNTQFFPYQYEPMPLVNYWKQTKERAEQAITETAILRGQPSLLLKLNNLVKTKSGISLEPSPLQMWVSKQTIPMSPHLFVLEDVTGAGKTEAAVLLAHQLMKAGQGNSLYFALPTMATANSMYMRMAAVYRKLFSIKPIPSLVLAHGASDMSEEFRQSIIPAVQTTMNSYGDETLEAGAHCNAWLADNRKKAMLADVGVGTIDQALLAILPSRHQSLRLLGLINKILVVDEVHACDSYMHELLCALLFAHAVAGGSVILLSATLPHGQRQSLLRAYASGRRWPEPIVLKCDSLAYPLATRLNSTGLSEETIDTRDSVKRDVGVSFISKDKTIDSLLVDAVAQGHCICWIRNTVKDAIEAYRKIRMDHPDWKIDLFHARYALGDRLDIEKRVVERFGKNSTSNIRQGQILIATQVVEQSLDLDFDAMITDLAPIDLLIQRAGRLHRHTRNQAGDPVEGHDQRGEIRLHIFSPEVTQYPDKNWYGDFFKNAKKVYENHAQLWLTASLLYKKRKFRMPEDARTLIESVYDSGVDIPGNLLNWSIEAEGHDKAEAGLAQLNTLSLEGGYSDLDTNHWWDEAKTPTRLGEETTIVYLAKWLNGVLRPWKSVADHAWQLSAVSMRTYWIATESTSSDITQKHVEQCKVDLPAKGKWGVLLPLTEMPGGDWQGVALNGNEEVVHFVYNHEFGLTVNY